MKKLTLILLSLLTTTLMAQNLDVTAYSQNITLVDTPAIQQEIPRQLATYPSISESCGYTYTRYALRLTRHSLFFYFAYIIVAHRYR